MILSLGFYAIIGLKQLHHIRKNNKYYVNNGR